jgi:methylated-DNA-[protein]-cysteine S-methyltransferase
LRRRRIRAAFPEAAFEPGTGDDVDAACKYLDEYFAGRLRAVYQGRLDLRGTEFEIRVWRLLSEIGAGGTRTYKELAREIPGTYARAVGAAVGKNPVSIIVPCHRVVGSDGSLTGYAGGIERKEFLLKHEGSSVCQKSLFEVAARVNS